MKHKIGMLRNIDNRIWFARISSGLVVVVLWPEYAVPAISKFGEVT